MIPVNTPLLAGNEKISNRMCGQRMDFLQGPFVEKFETRFAAMVEREHAIAVSNGSVGLDAAVAALEIGAGDEVILPSFTIISCAAAVVRAGAIPVVVDLTLPRNMTAEAIEAAITPRTKAIMAVHIYGHPCDMDPILALAAEHNLYVIEDALKCTGKPIAAAVRQFRRYQHVQLLPEQAYTTGEGGMLVTNDAHLAERCRVRAICFLTISSVLFMMSWAGTCG